MGLKIVSIGTYTPKMMLTSEEHDAYRGWKKGTSYKNSKIQRYYIADSNGSETVVKMAAKAIEDACKKKSIQISDLDLIIKASATHEQPLPCGGALIQEELGLGTSGIPAFDVDSTCLSFVVAMNIAHLMLEAGQYNRICVVSSEIPTVAMNNNQPNSASLFNDGAICYIFERSESTFHYVLNTYGIGAQSTQIRGGGSTLPATDYGNNDNNSLYTFDMNGLEVFRLSERYIKDVVGTLLRKTNKVSINEFETVIPHQASYTAMRLIERSLKLEKNKLYNVIEQYGNMVSSSIPRTLFDAICTKHIKNGDTILLIGTSAGLSIGGIVLELDSDV